MADIDSPYNANTHQGQSADDVATHIALKAEVTADMQSAINALSSVYQVILVSGTSIKTINGASVLGSGDLVVSGGGSLTVTEVDGNPSFTATTLRFANGTVTDAGGGVAAIAGLTGPTGATGATGSNGATGATGAAGPNTVTAATTTNLTGVFYGNGSTVAVATTDQRLGSFTKAQLDTAISDGNSVYVGDALNGTLGATTPASAAVTTLTASGIATVSVATGTAYSIEVLTPNTTGAGIRFRPQNLSQQIVMDWSEIRANQAYLIGTQNGALRFFTVGSLRWDLTTSGHIVPVANNTYDVGTSSLRTRKLWAVDADLSGDLICSTAGKGLQLKSGTGARAGNTTLVAGTVTVTNTTVTANTVVYLTRKTSGGTIGTSITYTLSAGASFTINSDNPLDTSIFSYVLIEVNP